MLAAVAGYYTGSLGYFTGGGDVVLWPQPNLAYRFREGKAGVKMGERFGFIDDHGKIVIEPRYENVGHLRIEKLLRSPVPAYGFSAACSTAGGTPK